MLLPHSYSAFLPEYILSNRATADARHYFLESGLGGCSPRQFGNGFLDSEDVTLAEVDYSLVRRHHDRSVRNLADELREEAAIEAAYSLLFRNQEKRLPESTVTAALLTKARSSNFYKNNNRRS